MMLGHEELQANSPPIRAVTGVLCRRTTNNELIPASALPDSHSFFPDAVAL
jgi:hypothetical protein